jgi:hypothetical protein
MAELFDQRVHIPPASAFSIQKHRSALWLLIWLNVILRYRHKAALISHYRCRRLASAPWCRPAVGANTPQAITPPSFYTNIESQPVNMTDIVFRRAIIRVEAASEFLMRTN